MKLDSGLAILELQPNVPNVGGTTYPVLIWDEENVLLVDAGLPGQAETIMKLVRQEGVQPEKITKIIITHQDMDHIGSLAQLANNINSSGINSKNVEVLSHEIEKPYIQFDKMPVKFTQETLEKLKMQMAQLSNEHQKEINGMFSNTKPEVTDVVTHEQELPFCGGIKILHTPGHTPGHICIYLKKYKTLIAGDALNIEEERLAGPNPKYTFDMDQAKKSLAALLDYEIERIICYHGGALSGDITSKIKEHI